MDRIIQSPGKYIQGAGAIKRLGDYLKPLAERWPGGRNRAVWR